MERMTREQMVAEFGAPGVENPMIMDLIKRAASGEVVLSPTAKNSLIGAPC